MTPKRSYRDSLHLEIVRPDGTRRTIHSTSPLGTIAAAHAKPGDQCFLVSTRSYYTPRGTYKGTEEIARTPMTP